MLFARIFRFCLRIRLGNALATHFESASQTRALRNKNARIALCGECGYPPIALRPRGYPRTNEALTCRSGPQTPPADRTRVGQFTDHDPSETAAGQPDNSAIIHFREGRLEIESKTPLKLTICKLADFRPLDIPFRRRVKSAENAPKNPKTGVKALHVTMLQTKS